MQSAAARASRPGRRGFILFTVLGVSVIIGGLVFMYYQGFRHRDAQVRMSLDRAHARMLSRAGVDTLKAGVREASDVRLLQNPQLDSGSLLIFLLNPEKKLIERFESKTRGKADHRELIEQLLGTEALVPLDKLVKKLPDAKVQLFLEIKPARLWHAEGGEVLADPVPKFVTLVYRVVAKVRKSQETFRATETIAVHSLLPAGISRFTLAMTAELATANTHRVTTRGEDNGGTAPIVLMHSPEDGDPMSENPFDARPTAQKPLRTTAASASDLLKVAKDRGMLYLPGTEERPAILQLASGGTPFGEYHTVYAPQSGKTSFPVAQNLPEQPATVKSFRGTDPRDRAVKQQPFIQAGMFGFFAGLDEQQLLGQPPSGAVPDGASQLKIFGTGTHPSAGVVAGYVHRAMAGLSDVAIDRDSTGRDESDQQAAVGKPLPVRETIDPFLRNASAGEYGADAGAEGTGAPLRRLLPFSPLVENMNALADMDGDGRRERTVSSELDHLQVPLDLAQWKYSALFEGYEEYQRVMSKYATFPANRSLELGSMPLDRARETLLAAAFGKPGQARADDWVLDRFELALADPLHNLMIDSKEGPPAYLDTRKSGSAALRAAIATGMRTLYPGEDMLVVRGQRRFEELFMPGGQIDLQGLNVTVVREKPEDPAPLSFDNEVTIRPGSGGSLSCERFRAKAIKNGGAREGFAPFTLRVGQLVMTGKGPYECVLSAGDIVQEKVTDFTVLRGAAAMENLPAGLMHPLVIAWDPRLDPTGPFAHLYYRLGIARDPKRYDLEDRP